MNRHRIHSCDAKEPCQVEPDLIPVLMFLDYFLLPQSNPKNPDTYGKHDRTYFEGL